MTEPPQYPNEPTPPNPPPPPYPTTPTAPYGQYPTTPPPPYGQHPGFYNPPPTGTNGFAIASLVFGIIGGCFLGIIFGIVALTKIKKTGQKGRGMAIAGLILSGLWIALIAVGLVLELTTSADRDASGTIVGGGTVTTDDLRVGDCVKIPKKGVVYDVAAVPCSEPHTGEVFSNITLTETTFPGDDELSQRAEEDCVDELDRVAPAVFDDEDYGIFWFQPTDETWDDGDRVVTCLVTTEEPQTGSIND